jgi:hypothetical protein
MQIYATVGVIGVGIVVGWCFGREYADRTVVSLYASATPRQAVWLPSRRRRPLGTDRAGAGVHDRRRRRVVALVGPRCVGHGT